MKLRLNEAPDAYGLPTDDELEQEFQAKKAEIHKQRAEKENDVFANAYPVALDLLNIEEADELPKDIRRYSDWYWLQLYGLCHSNAASVYGGGLINYDGESVDADDGCIRPVLTLSNIDSSSLKLYKEYTTFGDKWIYIGDNKFLYNDAEIASRFDAKSNNYESSEIKRFLNSWLRKLQSKTKANESYKHIKSTRKINESSSIIPSAKLKNIFSDLDDIETICGDTFNWSDSSWTYDAVSDLADALGACISSLRMNCRG